MPAIISCLELRHAGLGGTPTYWLTDNERTVSVGHLAGIARATRS